MCAINFFFHPMNSLCDFVFSFFILLFRPYPKKRAIITSNKVSPFTMQSTANELLPTWEISLCSSAKSKKKIGTDGSLSEAAYANKFPLLLRIQIENWNELNLFAWEWQRWKISISKELQYYSIPYTCSPYENISFIRMKNAFSKCLLFNFNIDSLSFSVSE